MSREKDKLKKLLKKRSGRKAVKPADLYETKSVRRDENIKVKNKESINGKDFTSKPPKKFASYLLEESIKELKRIAIDVGKHDYEVLQEAVDRYIKNYHQDKK